MNRSALVMVSPLRSSGNALRGDSTYLEPRTCSRYLFMYGADQHGGSFCEMSSQLEPGVIGGSRKFRRGDQATSCWKR